MTATGRGFWTALPFYDPAAPLLFNSGAFLAVFLVFYALYLAARRRLAVRLAYLLGFSWFFYYKTSGVYLLALVASCAAVWWIAGRANAAGTDRARRAWIGAGLAVLFGALGWFKYANLLLETIAQLAGGSFARLDIFLPIGISFYTFHAASYLIDVGMRRMAPARSFFDFALFVAFFPQLVAGPIVRASELLVQLRQPVPLDRAAQGRAFRLIAGGLVKKAVLADYLAANFVDRVFDDPGLYGGLETLLAVYGYAIQIYGDFSGYSDMALGLAILIGYRLPENFDAPYQSASITEFWRRWHMSLSRWLRDYLYIGLLGGNRLGTLRTYGNLMLTMLLGGLWHGAAWKFMAWGGLHGAALAVERAAGERFRPPRWLGRLLTFHFVCLAWIFFRAPTLSAGLDVLGRIASGIDLRRLAEFQRGYPLILPFLAAGFLLHATPKDAEVRADDLLGRAPVPVQSLVLATVILAVVQVRSAAIQPFIYFQF